MWTYIVADIGWGRLLLCGSKCFFTFIGSVNHGLFFSLYFNKLALLLLDLCGLHLFCSFYYRLLLLLLFSHGLHLLSRHLLLEANLIRLFPLFEVLLCVLTLNRLSLSLAHTTLG